MMYLLWGNIHMGVILGIISLVLMLAGDFLEKYELRSFEPADPDIEGKPLAPAVYVAIIGLAFAASVMMRRAWPLAVALDLAEDYEKLFDDGLVAFYRCRDGG